MDDEFPESLNFTILAQSILCISLLSSQPPIPKRHSREDKSGKGNYYKTISFDIFLFTTKTEQSHEIIGTLTGSLLFYSRDIEWSTEGKQHPPSPLL